MVFFLIWYLLLYGRKPLFTDYVRAESFCRINSVIDDCSKGFS